MLKIIMIEKITTYQNQSPAYCEIQAINIVVYTTTCSCQEHCCIIYYIIQSLCAYVFMQGNKLPIRPLFEYQSYLLIKETIPEKVIIHFVTCQFKIKSFYEKLSHHVSFSQYFSYFTSFDAQHLYNYIFPHPSFWSQIYHN